MYIVYIYFYKVEKSLNPLYTGWNQNSLPEEVSVYQS